MWVAMETNRLIAAHVAQAPDRLTGLGVVPLQHPSRIVEYLDDAVLGRGLAGVEISSFAGDVELSDERLEPFWARAAELGAVVFLHPFGCSLDERLDRFYLSNTVGQPTENAVALSHLIFSGVLDRHPDLKIVAAHGGGYLPFAIGRSDRAWRVRPEARRCEHEPSSYLRKLWFDTVVHDPAALRHLVEVAGGSRACCSAATSRSTWGSTTRSPRSGRPACPTRSRAASSARTPRRCSRRGCAHEDRALGGAAAESAGRSARASSSTTRVVAVPRLG